MDDLPAPGADGARTGTNLFPAPGPGDLPVLQPVRPGSLPGLPPGAPVGQHCVECVREGHQGTRAPTAVFGGRPAMSSIVTWVIVGLNVLFYLVELAYPALADNWAMVAKFGPHIGVADGQYYRLSPRRSCRRPAPAGCSTSRSTCGR